MPSRRKPGFGAGRAASPGEKGAVYSASPGALPRRAPGYLTKAGSWEGERPAGIACP